MQQQQQIRARCAIGSDQEQRLSQQQKVSRCPVTAFVSSLRREQGGVHGRSRMRSKSDTAWRTAARMAALAEEADDVEEREHYTRLRDAWSHSRIDASFSPSLMWPKTRLGFAQSCSSGRGATPRSSGEGAM